MEDRPLFNPTKPYTRKEFEAKLERDFLEGKMTEKIDPDARLTLDQAADLLGVSRRTIYNHIRDGLLQVEHVKGKPYIRRGNINGYLDAKNAGIKKTEFVPDGCILIKEEAWHQTRQIAADMTVRVSSLTAQVQNLLTYERQVQDDAEQIAALKAENEKLKSRGLWDRLFNKGVDGE